MNILTEISALSSESSSVRVENDRWNPALTKVTSGRGKYEKCVRSTGWRRSHVVGIASTDYGRRALTTLFNLRPTILKINKKNTLWFRTPVRRLRAQVTQALCGELSLISPYPPENCVFLSVFQLKVSSNFWCQTVKYENAEANKLLPQVHNFVDNRYKQVRTPPRTNTHRRISVTSVDYTNFLKFPHFKCKIGISYYNTNISYYKIITSRHRNFINNRKKIVENNT